MKAMGGTFDIRSSRGHGTSATLSLPVANTPSRAPAGNAFWTGTPGAHGTDGRTAAAHLPTARSTSTVQSGTPFSKQRIRVLLVDDHAMVREGLRSVLESYDDVDIVGEASTGQEALALVERFRPALVVMDINMPGMNGIEATAHITKIYPETLVIGLSVNATGNNVQAMLKAGAILLLTKEAAVNELYRRMREVLTIQVGSGSQ
jgi:CheY-like chemotaxis protein